MSASLDYQAGGEAGYTGSYVDTGTAFGADYADYPKYSQFSAAPQSAQLDQSWANLAQNVISFGISRAFDNTLPGQQTGIQGNTNPGSFAGQNGRTYNQVGGVNAAPTLSGLVASVERMNPLVLAGLAVAAYFLLKK